MKRQLARTAAVTLALTAGLTPASALAASGPAADQATTEPTYHLPSGSPAQTGIALAADTPSDEAAEDPSAYPVDGDWIYQAESGSAVIRGYTGDAEDVTVPATVGGLPVTSILLYQPSDCTFRSIELPATVKSIGAYAFYGMQSLQEIRLPADSQLTEIGTEAFAYTGLTSFTMPASLRTIRANAFQGCHELEFIQFNDELEPLTREVDVYDDGDHFQYTAPVALGVFCDRVSYRVPDTSKNFQVKDGLLLSRDGTVLYERPYSASDSSCTVPEGVTQIAEYAFFAQDGLSSITLPSTLTTIYGHAFAQSGLIQLTIPDSVTTVYGAICKDCPKLKRVTIGDGVTELGCAAGWEAFQGCHKLTQVTLGASVQIIGDSCFAQTALERIDIPASVRQINYGAFSDNPHLTRVTGAEGVQTIGPLAFGDTGLTTFPFGDDLRLVSGEAFQGCSSFTHSYPSYLSKNASGDWVSPGFTMEGDATVRLEGTDVYSQAFDVLNQVNRERANAGLSALTMDEDLLAAAMQRAAETAVLYGDTRPDGQSFTSISAKAYAENIAAGPDYALAAMDAWMGSPAQRNNILSTRWTTAGAGCFLTADGTYHWALLFGSGAAEHAVKPADEQTSRLVSIATDTLDPKLALTLPGAQSLGVQTLNVASDYEGAATVRGTNPSYERGFTASNEGFTWSSSDTGVLTVDKAGRVRAVADGTAVLTATSGNLSVSVTVEVGLVERTYSDVVAGSWYENAVSFVSSKGLITGYSDSDRFGVGDSMTRAQLATVLWRMAEPEEAAAYTGVAANRTGMPDVAADQWYTGAANWATRTGVINGVAQADGSRRFDPEGRLTREQFASIVANFVNADTADADHSALSSLADSGQTSPWAKDNMAWAVSQGLINGVAQKDGSRLLQPTQAVPREQAAGILFNAFEKEILS